MMFFFILGIVYGKVVGIIKNDKDVVKMMGFFFVIMGGYFVLVFVVF